MADTTNRKINIWINSKQVENNFRSIADASRKATNELSRMTIGSKQYNEQAAKIRQLKALAEEHRKNINSIGTAWGDVKNRIRDYAAGNILAGIFDKAITTVQQGFTAILDSTKILEDGMTAVYTNLDSKAMEDYSESLKDTAKSVSALGFTMKDTTAAMFDAVSAGIQAADTDTFLNEAAILAKGGITSLSTSVDGMTSIMNAYGLAIGEANQVSNAFFVAQKDGKTNVEQLASNIGKAAPIAANLGISYQELMSAGAQLTLSGISTSESFNYLKAVFSNLLKPSTEAEKILRKFGVPVGATQVKAAGLTKTLEALNKVIATNPDEIAKAIPSSEALTAVMALSGEKLENYKAILERVNTDYGEGSSLTGAYEKQTAKLSDIIAVAKAKVANYASELGDKLAPTIKSIIAATSGWAKKVMQLVDFFIKYGSVISTFAKVLTIATITVIAYNVAVKATALYTQLATMWTNRNAIATGLMRNINLLAAMSYNFLTGNIARATAAQRLLNITMKMNPIAFITGLIVAAAGAFLAFGKDVKEATKEQLEFNKAQAEGQAILTNTKKIEDRYKIIDSLNKRQLEQLKSEAAKELEIIEDKEASFIAKNKKTYLEKLDLLNKEFATGNAIQKAQVNAKKIALDEEFRLLLKNESGLTEAQMLQTKKRLNNYITAADERLTKISEVEETEISSDTTVTESKEDLLKRYRDTYEKYQNEIQGIRRKMHLEELSDEEKAIQEVQYNYEDKFELLNKEISELEKLKAKKGKLSSEEYILLENFYSQRTDLELYMQAEILAIIQKYQKEREKTITDTQAKIDETLLTSDEAEKKRITDKYSALIEAAKKYGLDYTALLVAMQTELAETEPQRDALGFTDEDWKDLEKNVKYAEQLIGGMMDIWNSLNTIRKNENDAYLANFEKNNETEKEKLKQQFDSKIITEKKYNSEVQKLDNNLAKAKNRIAKEESERIKKQKIFEAGLNLLSGSIKIWSEYGANPIAAGILQAVLIASTAASIAAISSEPIPAYASGARVKKPTVALVGEAGEELILNNRMLRSPKYGPIAEDLARIQEGREPRILGKPSVPNFGAMSGAIARNQAASVVNNYNSSDNSAELAEMRKDIKEMTASIKNLKTIRAVISQDVQRRFDEDEKLRNLYNSF